MKKFAVLRGKIVEYGYDYRKFASEVLQISNVALSNKLNCKTSFTYEEMQTIIRWLRGKGCTDTVEYLFEL